MTAIAGRGIGNFIVPRLAIYAKIQPHVIVFGGGDLSHDRD